MNLGVLLNDTIAAVATPPGLSALAVIRISGPKALVIVKALARRSSFEPRYAHRCRLVSRDGETILDDVIVTWFKAPDSYSGEDIIEISCHGGYFSADSVMKSLLDGGARMALPGEFTQRAFLNGKLDLLQVEAVADIIHGQSRRQTDTAQRVLRGDLSKKLAMIKDSLITIASRIELELDFSDQDIEKTPTEELLALLLPVRRETETLLASYDRGRVMREGLSLVLAGRPNSGKSSLLNALLRENRAIISDIPGTTRDTIEEQFIHDDRLYSVIDTAGLRDSGDSIEKEGMARSRSAMESCDLILLLVDSTMKDDPDLEKDLLKNSGHPRTVVMTKTDLPAGASRSGHWKAQFPGEDLFFMNTGDPLHREQFLDELSRKAAKHFGHAGESLGINRLRHYDLIRLVHDDLLSAESGLRRDLEHDLISIDIRSAISHLDSLTGETRSEDILNRIFADFCIGK